ncbi:DEAD/DEAH box helicase [Aeromonas dhakensis]|uniref:DEAD/DEAH box helicase n=1 Tax=Aeromonas dhakensis TaxID=196024 RepID=UPI003987DD72
MNSPRSNSNSQYFERLDERIRRWVWQKGWTSLRDAQERAIPAILGADTDVIIAAATAAGKTEAAFLPIFTVLLNSPEPATVLYVSPLKALINDQWGRLNELCESLDIPVTGWHGDIAYSKKQKFLKSPSGVLLITPESLEALFVNRGSSIPGMMANIKYIVIDELHAFIGFERGKQIQSLMHRVELAIGRQVPRIGLSATLGDMSLAAAFLRPSLPGGVQIINSKDGGQELKVLIKAYVEGNADPDEGREDEDLTSPYVAICNDLYRALRGSNNLVFPNSRSNVEKYTDRLRRLCEQDKVPNQFWAHHGSLSKTYREETEQALKSGDIPATAICTSTLELGIDIGSVKSICQIGRPPAVSSLRQRLGRSGRRKGESAILRGYIIERELSPKTSISDSLRENLIQTIAMIRLLIGGWFEPPLAGGLHASTLVQQILSVISERGGIMARDLWHTLLSPGAPFAGFSPDDFIRLLRHMGGLKLIQQDSSGLLLHGGVGEKLVNNHEFYASFVSDEEYRLICASTQVGLIPISRPLIIGQKIIFAGRRWQVLEVNEEKKFILVTPSKGGTPPVFENCLASVHAQVRIEMRNVLAGGFDVPFLDATAQDLLAEARENFKRYGLDSTTLIEVGSNAVQLFPWSSDIAHDAFVLMLQKQNIDAVNEGLTISVNCSKAKLLAEIEAVLGAEISDEDLLQGAKNISREKWDWALSDELLRKSFASLRLDVKAAINICKDVMN